MFPLVDARVRSFVAAGDGPCLVSFLRRVVQEAIGRLRARGTMAAGVESEIRTLLFERGIDTANSAMSS